MSLILGSYPTAEMLSAYFMAPSDQAEIKGKTIKSSKKHGRKTNMATSSNKMARLPHKMT